jgi:ATP-dependent DNA helicase RecG
MDAARIGALIASRTIPTLQTRTSVVDVDGSDVIAVEVPAASRIVGTAGGLYVRRALKIDGTPQCVPFPAHEMLAREIDRGAVDFAALPAPDVTPADLDPLEFERFRRMVRSSNADPVLAELPDDEICRALGLLRWTEDGTFRPTLGAVLLFGVEAALRHCVPNHEIA